MAESKYSVIKHKIIAATLLAGILLLFSPVFSMAAPPVSIQADQCCPSPTENNSSSMELENIHCCGLPCHANMCCASIVPALSCNIYIPECASRINYKEQSYSSHIAYPLFKPPQT